MHTKIFNFTLTSIKVKVAKASTNFVCVLVLCCWIFKYWFDFNIVFSVLESLLFSQWSTAHRITEVSYFSLIEGELCCSTDSTRCRWLTDADTLCAAFLECGVALCVDNSIFQLNSFLPSSVVVSLFSRLQTTDEMYTWILNFKFFLKKRQIKKMKADVLIATASLAGWFEWEKNVNIANLWRDPRASQNEEKVYYFCSLSLSIFGSFFGIVQTSTVLNWKKFSVNNCE